MGFSTQNLLNTGHMVATRMMAERASSTQATSTRKPSRLSMPERGLASSLRQISVTATVSAMEARMKISSGRPTPPSPKACSESTTPLRTR